MPWPWVKSLLDYWHITPPISESLAALARDQRFVTTSTANNEMSREARDANNRMAAMTMPGAAPVVRPFSTLPPLMQDVFRALKKASVN